MSKGGYHPTQRAVQVFEANVARPDVCRPSLLSSSYRHHTANTSTQDKERRVLRRLLDYHHMLPDPVGDLLYSQGRSKNASPRHKQVVHIVPQCGVGLPDCCAFHGQQVNDLVLQHKQFLYNSPEPSIKDTPNIPHTDRLVKLVRENTEKNAQKRYPLSTVNVHWHVPYFYGYYKLYDALEQFGPIEVLEIKSPNSAVVVYRNLSDSCDAVFCNSIGSGREKLFIHWLHKSMASRSFYSNNKGIKAFNNNFIHRVL